MKLSEIFDSQNKRTVELTKERTALKAKSPDIERQYAEDDTLRCIPKAAESNAAQSAGSPTALQLGVELRQLRAQRDAPKAAYRRELNRTEGELERLTMPKISAFHEYALDVAKNLSKRLILEKSEPFYSVEKDTRYVTVRTNEESIAEAVELVIRRIHQVREMQHSTLAEIAKKISDCRREFEAFDLTIVEDEVTLPAATAPRPIRPKQAFAEVL
jgi:hypothetical protein